MCKTHQDRTRIPIHRTKHNQCTPFKKKLQQKIGYSWNTFSSQSALNSSNWECLKWLTMRLPAAIKSVMLRCDKTLLDMASWSVCTMHDRLVSVMAFSMFQALSRRIMRTFSLGIPHVWNKSLNALAMCDPENSWEFMKFKVFINKLHA